MLSPQRKIGVAEIPEPFVLAMLNAYEFGYKVK